MEISKRKGSMRQSMRVYMVSKRILDIVLSLCALLILSPIFLAVFMIDCFGENKGPIVYKQVRIGLHGKPFKIIKFRSMIIDADKKLRKDPKLYHVENQSFWFDFRIKNIISIFKSDGAF
ncbi:hypothetical protein GTP11_14830 [Lactiplantibacillus plantarum]|uniref:sugar transferase n=1 Tax=Lactiplantibacillus plantarum TaxID=1590 RepID=UPI001AAF1773|nr:sugar transferase [Lactiplantibacillus plantarum]MBO2714322.1 hypothetical protein [Lactiplantibacillus plantarum]